MIDRRVGLSLSRGERVWGRFLFCGDERLGCMVERDYTALTLVEMIDRRDGLPLSRGERVWGRFLFCDDEKLGCMVDGELLWWRLMETDFSMRGVRTSP